MARRGEGRPQDDRPLPFHGGALNLTPLAALSLCRALGDGATLTLFGAALFAAGLVPPALQPAAARRVARLARYAVPMAAAATSLRLPLLAGAMGDGWADTLSPATLLAVLRESAPGRAWAVQAAVMAALVLVAARRGSAPALAAIAGTASASLALSGHAAALPGLPGWLAGGALALHLLAAGAWIGSLPEVLHLLRGLARHGEAEDAALALRRFSGAGHGAVALLIVTGALDTALIAGLSMDLAFSAYGAVLAVKLALAAGMAGLAILNRYRLVPRLRHRPQAAGRALVANTRAVLLLGFGAVAASGVLGLLDPP